MQPAVNLDATRQYNPAAVRSAKEKQQGLRAPLHHTFFIFVLCLASLFLTAGASPAILNAGAGESDSTAAVGASAALSMADFNIYYDGRELLDIHDALNGTFWFTFADTYVLEGDTLETARGIGLLQPDADVLDAYGGLAASIEYTAGRTRILLTDTTYGTWAASGQYCANYSVTFRQFTINGWEETDAERVAKLYEQNTSRALAEYGVTFVVQNGVVQDIECYTHALN